MSQHWCDLVCSRILSANSHVVGFERVSIGRGKWKKWCQGLRKRGRGACAGAWLDLFWTLVVKTANRRIGRRVFWLEGFSSASSFRKVGGAVHPDRAWGHLGTTRICQQPAKPGELYRRDQQDQQKLWRSLRSLNRLHFPSLAASLSWEEFDRDFLSKEAISICL
jgi:hypothetical protein